MAKIKTGISIATYVLLLYATQGYGAVVGYVDGEWSNTLPEANPTIEENIEGLNGFNDIRYGTPINDTGEKSGLGFKSDETPYEVTRGKPFSIGLLKHYNNKILLSNTASGVDLEVNLSFSDPWGLGSTFLLTLIINETPNGDEPGGVPDTIHLSPSQVKEPVKIGKVMYTLEILGFGDEADELQEKLVSPEEDTTQTTVWARLTAEPLPDFTLIQATTQLLLEE